MDKRGFVTALAVVVSLTILIFFSGIYHIIQTNAHENIVIDLRDQSGAAAEAGVQDAINKIRVTPDLSYLDEHMVDPANNGPLLPANTWGDDGLPVPPTSTGFYSLYHEAFPKTLTDSSGKRLGQFFVKAKTVDADAPSPWDPILKDEQGNDVEGNVYHIVSEGWAFDKRDNPQSHSTSHAFVYIANVGNYFCAVKGDLEVAAGSKLANAKVYGRSLKFNPDPSGVKITEVGRADYYADFEPYNWPLDQGKSLRILSGGNSGQAIDNAPDGTALYLPNRLPGPLIFPSIHEQVAYYKDRVRPTPIDATLDRCNFANQPLEPPSVDSTYNHPGVFTNRDHAYYCGDVNGAIFGPGDVKVRGQVIVAVEGPVRFSGNIIIDNGDVGSPQSPLSNGGYSPPDPDGSGPPGVPSTADQLIIYAQGGFIIDKNWCNNAGNTLKLQGVLLISPDGKIEYENGACSAYSNYSLDFFGAMFLSASPAFGDYFKATVLPANFDSPRQYRYLDTLQTAPPPIREFYQVLKQFTLRRAKDPAPT